MLSGKIADLAKDVGLRHPGKFIQPPRPRFVRFTCNPSTVMLHCLGIYFFNYAAAFVAFCDTASRGVSR